MSMAGLIARKGAQVTFTLVTSTRDESTDQSTSPVSSTVTGKAMQIDGDPDMYKEASLTETDNPTLLFTPDVVGQTPPKGSSVAWGADTFVVKRFKPLAMNGTATAAMVIVGR